jgi:DNA-binding GntR family transcriptional regulator
MIQKTASDLAFEELRAAIVEGRLQPGLQLRQGDIARRLGFSHIPLREALRRLEAEGLVKIKPMCGATVAELSAKEFEELSEMRAALESLALRLAAPNLDSADLRRAGDLLNRMDRMSSHWGELNAQFHGMLYAAADRPRLMQQINSLHKNVDRYVALEEKVGHRLEGTQKEHRLLLELLTSRKVDQAVSTLCDHILVPGRLLAAKLRTKGLI